jgi:hypothetical protein
VADAVPHVVASYQNRTEDTVVNQAAYSEDAEVTEETMPECPAGFQMVEGEVAIEQIAGRHRCDVGENSADVRAEPQGEAEIESADVDDRDGGTDAGKA